MTSTLPPLVVPLRPRVTCAGCGVTFFRLASESHCRKCAGWRELAAILARARELLQGGHL